MIDWLIDPPKLPQNGQFQAKRGKYKNRDISQNIKTIKVRF